ncbi:MAG: hypothetical protein WBP11_03990 [Dokdonella sp.]
MKRPVLFVLAGVNGAGKSSVGGHLLKQAGQAWFNPDDYARQLVDVVGCDQARANAAAWEEGVRRLDTAIANRDTYAFETTLGGTTIPARIRAASVTHDVLMWYCGLSAVDLHLARVRSRVAAGGHDIPEQKIHERWTRSIENLIALQAQLALLRVYDNSAEAKPGQPIPDPVLVAEIVGGRLLSPRSVKKLKATPDWAKPILEAALVMDETRRR